MLSCLQVDNLYSCHFNSYCCVFNGFYLENKGERLSRPPSQEVLPWRAYRRSLHRILPIARSRNNTANQPI